MNSRFDTIIVGGGLAGLACARRLCAEGLSCQLLEASDHIGGRLRTDDLDGFLLDRGFQVFLTAYPEAKAVLNYEDLRLRPFEPGALIRFNGGFHRLADPWRRPRHLLATALSKIATLGDKLRIASFRKHTTAGTLAEIYDRPERTTIELLRDHGFSDAVVNRFFRPFLGGVFLDRELQTSSRMCEFVFRMFSSGDATLPSQGMSQIPQQLARRLPNDVIRTACPVDWIDGQDVVLASGERLNGRSIVVATDAPTSRRLLGDWYPADGRSVSCLYFAADKPPVKEPILVLNGDGEGPINNLCVPSQVSPEYAPAGQSLVSVTTLGSHANSEEHREQVVRQLEDWFGAVVKTWRHLRTYDIGYALPIQDPPALQPVAKPSRVRDGVFVCGDHCDTASINGALASGSRAAETVLDSLKETSLASG